MGQSVEIKDLQVRDVVLDMAKILGIEAHEDDNEICIDIPDAMGKGYIKAISFDHGIGVLEVDCQLNEKTVFELNNSMVQPLKIIFNRETAFAHRFSGKETTHSVGYLESLMVSSDTQHGHIFEIPAKEPMCIFSLEINRKLFEEKIEMFLSDMDEDLEQLFKDVNGVNLFHHKGHFSLDISRLLEEFSECDLDGFMRSVFLEGKAYEILTQQLRLYLDDLSEPDDRKILRQSTIEKVKEAADIIAEDLENITSIVSLGQKVGLNQKTLQLGFKYLYKTSVNTYIRNVRIEKAKELLETTDLNITEITYKIGINSRSYFSKLFKKKYGMAPKKYLDEARARRAKSKSA